MKKEELLEKVNPLTKQKRSFLQINFILFVLLTILDKYVIHRLYAIITGIIAVCVLIMMLQVYVEHKNFKKQFPSYKGYTEYLEWKKWKKYIMHFTEFEKKNAKKVKLWDKYLIYATALGITDEVKKSIEIDFPYLVEQTVWYELTKNQ